MGQSDDTHFLQEGVVHGMSNEVPPDRHGPTVRLGTHPVTTEEATEQPKLQQQQQLLLRTVAGEGKGRVRLMSAKPNGRMSGETY